MLKQPSTKYRSFAPVKLSNRTWPDVRSHHISENAGALAHERIELEAMVLLGGEAFAVTGRGNGPIEAFVNGFSQATGHRVRVLDYHEHALGSGASAALSTRPSVPDICSASTFLS